MHDLVRAALGHKKATLISTLGTKINNMICGPDDIHHLNRHDNDSSGLGTVRYFFTLYRTSLPLNTALSPNSSSMRMSWLYLARRSLREVEPVFSWPPLYPDRSVGEPGVFGLAGAVGEDRGEPGAVCHLHGLHGFGERTDLVHLDEDGVTLPFLQCPVRYTYSLLQRCRRPLSALYCQDVS